MKDFKESVKADCRYFIEFEGETKSFNTLEEVKKFCDEKGLKEYTMEVLDKEGNLVHKKTIKNESKIKSILHKLSMAESIDVYDLNVAGDDKYEFCYVTELERNGKRYEAWQIHEREDGYRAGKLIYDKEVYDRIAENLLRQFPNFDITVSSRQYKYAPEMKPELLLCIPVEVDEFYHFMEGNKFKMEGIDGLCTIIDFDEYTQTYDYVTEDGNVLSFNSDDMPKITLLKETNEVWGTMGGGSCECIRTNESSYNMDFPKDELSVEIKDALRPLFDLDDEGNTYITNTDFKEYVKDLEEENPDLLDDIKMELGDAFDKLVNDEITTLTLLQDEEPSMKVNESEQIQPTESQEHLAELVKTSVQGLLDNKNLLNKINVYRRTCNVEDLGEDYPEICIQVDCNELDEPFFAIYVTPVGEVEDIKEHLNIVPLELHVYSDMCGVDEEYVEDQITKDKYLYIIKEMIDNHPEYGIKLNEEFAYIGGGSFEIELPTDIIDSICHSGSNDLEVAEAIKDERVRKELDKYTDEEIDKIFRYDGFDMTEEEMKSKTRAEKEEYIIWSAAWDAFDNRNNELDENFQESDKEAEKNICESKVKSILKQYEELENTFNESLEDSLKAHKNLAPEVKAEKLAKEINDKKEEKPKMDDKHKKVWKEIKESKVVSLLKKYKAINEISNYNSKNESWSDAELRQVGAITEKPTKKYKIYQNGGGEIAVTKHVLNNNWALMDESDDFDYIADKMADDWSEASWTLYDEELLNDVDAKEVPPMCVALMSDEALEDFHIYNLSKDYVDNEQVLDAALDKSIDADNKLERNRELLHKRSARKLESKINEKEDIVYELENRKTGRTIWSHTKTMPGYKFTGKTQVNGANWCANGDVPINEEEREILEIKFVGVDEWGRPTFRPMDKSKKYFLTDVNNLFSENSTEKEIKEFYSNMTRPLREYIIYKGSSFDSEPAGSTLKFDLEIV